MFTLISCDFNTVFYQFDHTPLQGWEKNDTLTFDIHPTERAGQYVTTIGVRVNNDYPFTALNLIVDQTIYSKPYKGGRGYSRHLVESDTVEVHITNTAGNKTGQGLTLYQYDVPLHLAPSLSPGDSIHYAVRHNMKRSILPGIADVGLRLTKK